MSDTSGDKMSPRGVCQTEETEHEKDFALDTKSESIFVSERLTEDCIQ